jgi:hypothetical protein
MAVNVLYFLYEKSSKGHLTPLYVLTVFMLVLIVLLEFKDLTRFTHKLLKEKISSGNKLHKITQTLRPILSSYLMAQLRIWKQSANALTLVNPRR